VRTKGWTLALGAGLILLVAVGLTVGRGWLRRAEAPADVNILTGGGPGAAMDENALVAANAERPYRAPPPPPVRPPAEEAAAPAVPAAPAPRAAEPEDEEEQAPDKPIADPDEDRGE
jgi:hypothetical protein